MSRTIKQPYRKSRRFDKSCRCHGGCPYCLENRMHQQRKEQERMKIEHECKESIYCHCYIGGDTPDEKCPIHGWGEWPPRCGECGRFIKRNPD